MIKKLIMLSLSLFLLSGCAMLQTPQQQAMREEQREKEQKELEKQKRLKKINSGQVKSLFQQRSNASVGTQYGIQKTWKVKSKKNQVYYIQVEYVYDLNLETPTLIPEPDETEEQYMARLEEENKVSSSQRAEEYIKNLDEKGFYNQKEKGVKETYELIQNDNGTYSVKVQFTTTNKADFKKAQSFGNGVFCIDKYTKWKDVTYLSLYDVITLQDNIEVKEVFK